MKRWVWFFLAVLLVTLSAGAFATELEVTYWQVNFRSTPGGTVIGRFDGGEILEGLEETCVNGQLWYRARSDRYGEGYISAVYAIPVRNGQRRFVPAGEPEPDHLTDNMLAFRRDWYDYLFSHGYAAWENGVPAFRDPGDVPQAGTALAETLLKHGMLVENEKTAVLTDPASTEEARRQAASEILKAHYGTDDIWQTFIQFCAVGGPSADWHTPEYPTQNDFRREQQVFDEVSERYRGWETAAPSAAVSPDTVLYFNPDGGTKYHTDPNCPSANPEYLPFSHRFTWAEVNDEPYLRLEPCSVCGAPCR